MQDVLPAEVFSAIHDQYARAVQEAVDGYGDLQGDEDSLTGGLGQALRQVAGELRTDGRTFVWRTTVKKLRGRGPNAPESVIGADAFIEIEVLGPQGEVIRRKSVAIQAKKGWRGQNRELAKQARRLGQISGGGLVVDYSPDGYVAVDATTVASAEGNRAQIPAGSIRPLEETLAGDFLVCRIGTTEVYFDAHRQVLVRADPATGMQLFRFAPDLRIRTTINEL